MGAASCIEGNTRYLPRGGATLVDRREIKVFAQPLANHTTSAPGEISARRNTECAFEVPSQMALVEKANFGCHDRRRHAATQQPLRVPHAHEAHIAMRRDPHLRAKQRGKARHAKFRSRRKRRERHGLRERRLDEFDCPLDRFGHHRPRSYAACGARLATLAKRRMSNGSSGVLVAPVSISSAITSPTPGPSWKPCPQKPNA